MLSQWAWCSFWLLFLLLLLYGLFRIECLNDVDGILFLVLSWSSRLLSEALALGAEGACGMLIDLGAFGSHLAKSRMEIHRALISAISEVDSRLGTRHVARMRHVLLSMMPFREDQRIRSHQFTVIWRCCIQEWLLLSGGGFRKLVGVRRLSDSDSFVSLAAAFIKDL